MNHNSQSYLWCFSASIPDSIVTNEMIQEKYLLSAEHVSALLDATKIKERRYCKTCETVETLSIGVVNSILETSGLEKSDIGALIIATLTPTYCTPGTAAVVAGNCGLQSCFTYDLSAACSGWVYGIHQARALVQSGSAKHAIVIGGEKLSATLNDTDHKTAFLFGDGAAGCLVSCATSSDRYRRIVTTEISLVPDLNKEVFIKSPFADEPWTVPKFHLLGKKVYEHGVNLVVEKVLEYFSKNNLSWDDFRGFIPHQANGRMLREICEKLLVPETYLYTNIEKRGNTGAASIPLCICETVTQPGRYLLVSIGAGYTLGLIDVYL